MSEDVLNKILEGKSFAFKEGGLDLFIKDIFNTFKFNLSLKYPDKVDLPSEEFCQFYFKDLNHLSIEDRITVAYNDSMSMFFSKLFQPTYNGYTSMKHFLEESVTKNQSYLQKALLAKFGAKDYIFSNNINMDILSAECEELLKKNGMSYFSDVFSNYFMITEVASENKKTNSRNYSRKK